MVQLWFLAYKTKPGGCLTLGKEKSFTIDGRLIGTVNSADKDFSILIVWQLKLNIL